jgi:hypothetical protein
VLTLAASTSAAVTSNPVTVTITGTSGTLSTTTSLTATITAQSGFMAGNGGTTSITVARGATTGNTGTISVVGTNGFSGTVNLTCKVTTLMTNVNNMPTCSLSPLSVKIQGSTTQTSTLTINTTAATSANQLKKVFWPSAGGATLALLLLFTLPKRRNWLGMLGVLVLFVSVGTLGCGGGSSQGGGGGGNSGTTVGSYTITVTGTSGALSVTVGTVTLTVQ